jgi:hypothetical protein
MDAKRWAGFFSAMTAMLGLQFPQRAKVRQASRCQVDLSPMTRIRACDA